MLAGTEVNLKALLGIEHPEVVSIASEAEFLILLPGNHLFVTSGHHDVQTLKRWIWNGEIIHGSFYIKDDAPWQDTVLTQRPEAIIDLRSDSSGASKEEE